jgi:hypothetical protein
MPYNTRRKSLSLPLLGIQLPNASRSHRSNSKPTPPVEQASIAIVNSTSAPPLKKVKRSHNDNEPPSPVSSPRSPAASPPADIPAQPQRNRIKLEHTPPPSPGDVGVVRKVDTDGINDDIVIAVIEQLEKTANRPHLIKDLATVLASSNQSIAQYVRP